MHILIFLDQHMDTLGGVQSSVSLQKKYLEQLGHTVSVCSPSSINKLEDKGYIATPSFPITYDKEYHVTLPSKKIERLIDKKVARLAPVDVVHVQADYWGAILGISYARRHKLPCVITFHNNVEVGLEMTMGTLLGRVFIRLMSWYLKKIIPEAEIASPWRGWSYLDAVSRLVDVRLTPTEHFSRYLAKHGVSGDIMPMSNGIDDEVLAETVRTEPDVFTIVWSGRMSGEKRPLEYLKAIRQADIPAQYYIYGVGALKPKVEAYIHKHNMANVSLNGRLPYSEIMHIMASASLYVQTSIGFETQGMTVFEAASLGTPLVLCDKEIAKEFPPHIYYLTPNDSIEALAATIRKAYRALEGSEQKHYQLGSEYDFRQSTMTKRVLEVYQSAIDNR